MEWSICNREDSEIIGKVTLLASAEQRLLKSSSSGSTYDFCISGGIDMDDSLPYRLI